MYMYCIFVHDYMYVPNLLLPLIVLSPPPLSLSLPRSPPSPSLPLSPSLPPLPLPPLPLPPSLDWFIIT